MRFQSAFLLILCGCSDSTRDAGPRIDATTSQDAGTDAGPTDIGAPPEGLTLSFTAERSCSSSVVNPTDLNSVLQSKTQLRFIRGWSSLPVTEVSGPGEIIEALTVGRSSEAATKQNTGQWTWTADTGNLRNYTFEQPFDYQNTTWTLTFAVTIDVDPSNNQTFIIDESKLSSGDLRITFTDGNETRWLGSCTYTDYGCSSHQFDFQNNDILKIETCTYCPPMWMCKADRAGVRRAALSRSSTRFTDDYFHLAMSMRHHNWGQDILVMLPEPLGNVHGLYLGTLQYPDFNTFQEVRYVDENLATLEIHPVTSHRSITW